MVYHFMFGPGWQTGCPTCSSTADSFDGVLAHLAARDVTMICVSRAPVAKLLAYRKRRAGASPGPPATKATSTSTSRVGRDGAGARPGATAARSDERSHC